MDKNSLTLGQYKELSQRDRVDGKKANAWLPLVDVLRNFLEFDSRKKPNY